MTRARPWVRGGAAGVAATAAMTTLLVGAERIGVLPGQPPRLIVDRLLPGLDDRSADAVALALHVAYGAAGGAVLAGVLRERSGALLGAGYGALIWAAGYEGWVPIIGALPPAHRDHPRRVGVMLLAHLVYGGVLGRLLRAR